MEDIWQDITDSELLKSCESVESSIPCVNEDITDSELLKSCESTEFIVGRAILCVNDEEIFEKHFDVYLSDIEKSVKKASLIETSPSILYDKYYLFLLTLVLPNEIVIPENWTKKWSGCIILELLIDEYIGMSNTRYMGMLLFSKNTTQRDIIIQQSWFNTQDLLSKNCVIEWFTPTLTYQLLASQEVRFKKEPHYFILWMEAITLIANGQTSKKPGSVYNCLKTKWQVLTCIDKWLNQTECLHICNPLPNVNVLEYIFIFFHVSLRMYRQHIPPLHIFVKVIQQIKTNISNNTEMEKISETTVQQISEIGCNQYVVMNLINQFCFFYQSFKQSVELYSTTMKRIDAKRQLFYAFEIFANHKLDTILAENIKLAPATYFDQDKIQTWVENIHTQLECELSMTDTFDMVKKGLSCSRKHGLFSLYGTMDNIVSIITDDINFKCQYEIKTGLLSQAINKIDFEQSTPFWNSNKIILPWNTSKNNMTNTQKRCLLAFNLRSPIWCQWKNSSHDYFWLERVVSKQNGSNIDEILAAIYMTDFGMSYNHEVINPYLNISNVLLDIDIKDDMLHPNLIKSIQKNKIEFVRDLVTLIYAVFEQLLIKSTEVSLYLFENNRIDPHKQSFHVHIGLPSHVVIENQSECIEIVNILNNLRHFYPNTLGLPYYDIFDDAIYNKKGGIHSLRGPYQFKHNGTTKLECIYRNDNRSLNEPIPLHRQFIHGGQDNNYEGTIIHEIKNNSLISDGFFLEQTQNNKMDQTTEKLCLSNVVDLVTEMNKYVILFDSNDISLTLLEELINSIWKLNKSKIISWMRDEEYSSEHIQFIQYKCHFIVDRNDDSIRLVNSTTHSPNIPVCLRYNHQTHTDSTWYRIIFRNGMKCLLLACKCFKGRCEDKRVLSQRLDLVPIYFAPHVKDEIKMFLQSLDITNYICIEIVKIDKELKQIRNCPSEKDVLMELYTKGVDRVARLYLFIVGKYLCCRLVNNCYVLIEQTSNVNVHYTRKDVIFYEFLDSVQILEKSLQNKLKNLLK